MASKIVFFIFTVLKVNIVRTSASPQNVHEMMTPREISETFGTDDGSVPEYQVISVILPGARRKRQADDEIHFKVEIDDKEFNLIFKPTAGYLASRYTPVWSAVTNDEAYNGIRYDPLPNAMKNVGQFQMYQDVDNQAAIVVYADPDQDTTIQGIVTSDYAINTLPKRLSDRTHFEVTGRYVIFKISPSAENARRNAYRYEEKRESHSRERRQISPDVVYPEILLILDHNALRNHSITQALRFMLAFWNSVEMVYSTLNNPKVYLNIAGIIISADDAATPYITGNTPMNTTKHRDWSILTGLAKYFAKELDRFPLRQYDMILAMTPTKFCDQEDDDCNIPLGSASSGTACTSEISLKLRKEINGVGVVYYNRMFGGVRSAVQESAHLFNVLNDEGQGATLQCNYTEGYVMAATAEFRQQGLKWSTCSQHFFQNYFSLRKSRCLANMPMSVRPVKEVLPGRWLPLDGQCQNIGFKKSCQIPHVTGCRARGCEAEGSNECRSNRYIPLPGSKCGEDKYCTLSKQCVYL